MEQKLHMLSSIKDTFLAMYPKDYKLSKAAKTCVVTMASRLVHKMSKIVQNSLGSKIMQNCTKLCKTVLCGSETTFMSL